jgi:coenzyme Q-binding protein COQ10
MSKITFEKIINSNTQRVFDILTDFTNFDKILPEYYSLITVKSIRDESSLVVEHIHLLENEFVIMAKHFSESPKLHETRVVGGDIKGSYIIEKISQYEQKTKLVVHAEIITSKGVKNIFKKHDYETELKNLYQKFVNVIEQ